MALTVLLSRSEVDLFGDWLYSDYLATRHEAHLEPTFAALREESIVRLAMARDDAGRLVISPAIARFLLGLAVGLAYPRRFRFFGTRRAYSRIAAALRMSLRLA